VKSLEYNKNVLYVPSYAEAIEALKDATKENDVIVVLGAGNITKLAGALVA
jgi:UDP-N-acetylmuramate-alanine ligase